MRVLIILASVVCVGFAFQERALFGGVYVDNKNPSEFPKYLAQAKGQLPALKATDHIAVTAVSAETSYGRSKTTINLKVNNRPCHIVFTGDTCPSAGYAHVSENSCKTCTCSLIH